MTRRSVMLFGLLFALFVFVGIATGVQYTTLLLVQSFAYALIALGLNIQWGYGGLFNFSIMGMLMLGGAAVTFTSSPVNPGFWASEGPMLLGRAVLGLAVGLALVWGVGRIAVKGRLKAVLVVASWAAGYFIYRTQIDPAAAYIETTSGWVGGLGLNPVFGWILGGILAAGLALLMGKICLGLRTDYLAIATIGISEIIRALLKNMDWLTRGTKTVSPIPWPTPLPQDLQAAGMAVNDSFLYARLGFLAIAALILVVALFLVQRAYNGPWGRMMRAIRDNFISAGSMGKNVTQRQLELFVLGSVLMGIGGAMLVSFQQIYDPGAYQPINHTFLVWVMVIVGGAGNNFGAIFGGFLIYVAWMTSDQVAQAVLSTVSHWSTDLGWGAIPEIESRASQMRVFVLGIVITVAIRYFPRGLLPEVRRQ
jgi:branched-chain amino acid transport system permease protein